MIYDEVEKSLKACQKVCTALRRAIHDMKKLRVALTKLLASQKSRKEKDMADAANGANKLAKTLAGRTSIQKSVNMTDPMILQCFKDVLQAKEIRMVKDVNEELTGGASDASRPYCLRKGRNILKFMVKNDVSRAVLERTIDSFRETLLQGTSNKSVCLGYFLSFVL